MNKPVQITLGEPFANFVESEVESGRFASPQAVIEAGLRLLEEDHAKYGKLRALLIEGENSGEPRPFDPDAMMASVREAWKKRG
ncbi:type II toxin-antitoxin system ParD family antitoxin [Rhizobium sp. 0TCS1.26]|uniref:type II toxin-antitoxin system ParD family antitoxin n=1 Tax=Rhizobium sp. 0TCS1.26 TaxID=3142623 RepID=UPI003D2C4D1C